MALPALLSRLIIAALRRYAPRAVGAALKIAGAVQIGELIHDAYAAVFGTPAARRELVAGYQSESAEEEAPDELVAELREALAARELDRIRLADDIIDEEEILRQLDAAERIGSVSEPLNVNVKLTAPRERCRSRK